MKLSELLTLLFPHFALLHVSAISVLGTTLRISACCTAPSAMCTGCGTESSRVHSRYLRSVVDAAVGGQTTVIKLTFRYGRSTVQLRRLREEVALALAGRAGSRLTEKMAVGLGKDAMLRLIRALPDPQVEAVRVLGVDDFALKKGHVHGTVLIDLESGRPVDVLPERTSDALVAWLEAHPGTEIVCRDRAGCYSDGATRGAPAAVQVADRWHVWSNLGEAVENAVRRLRSQWIPPAPEPAPLQIPVQVDGPRAERIRERFTAVKNLGGKGMKVGRIAEELRLDRKTVRYPEVGITDRLAVHTKRARHIVLRPPGIPVRQDLGYIDHVEGPPRHPLPSHQGRRKKDHGRAEDRILTTTAERSPSRRRTS